MANATIVAASAATGTVEWIFHADGSTISTAPVYANGLVYVASETTIYAIRWDDASIAWSRPTECAGAQNLLLANGGLFVGGCHVVRLEPKTGAAVWASADVRCHEHCHMASASDRVFIPTDTGLTALDSATGSTLWSITSGPQTRPAQFAAVHNGYVYFGTSGAGTAAGDDYHFYLYKIDLLDGDVAWQQDLSFNGLTASPVFTDQYVIARVAAGPSNFLFALRVDDGSFVWSKSIGDFQCPVCSSPILVDGTIWVTAQGFLLGATRVPSSALYGFDPGNGSLTQAVIPPIPLQLMGTPAYNGQRFIVTFQAMPDGRGGAWSAAVPEP